MSSKTNKFGPDPNEAQDPKNTLILFLKNFITNEGIEVGDYTYFYPLNGHQGITEFQNKNVLYHFPKLNNDKLIIGKFCAIADGVKFIMNGANHAIDSISTYPFKQMNNGWQNIDDFSGINKGDTIIGNDVWIGKDVTIMPGVKIGNGVIIGTGAVVANDIPPYCVVIGNPGIVKRYRFSAEEIEFLENLKWWDLDKEVIPEIIPLLRNKNFNKLSKYIK